MKTSQERRQIEAQLISLIIPVIQRRAHQELEQKLQHFKDTHNNDSEIISQRLLMGYNTCSRRCGSILTALQTGTYSQGTYVEQLRKVEGYLHVMERFSIEVEGFGYSFDYNLLEELKQRHKQLSL